jgi:hypothetical protein
VLLSVRLMGALLSMPPIFKISIFFCLHTGGTNRESSNFLWGNIGHKDETL